MNKEIFKNMYDVFNTSNNGKYFTINEWKEGFKNNEKI